MAIVVRPTPLFPKKKKQTNFPKKRTMMVTPRSKNNFTQSPPTPAVQKIINATLATPWRAGR